MKRKYVAIILGIILGASSIVGCSNTSTADKTSESAESGDIVYGEIVSVDGDTISVNVGTLPEMTQAPSGDEGQAPGANTDQTEDESTDQDQAQIDGTSAATQEAPEEMELTLTGKTMTVVAGDGVKITDNSQMAAGMGQPGGEDGQTPPSIPSGDQSGDSTQTPPEKPSGDSSNAPENAGEMPDMSAEATEITAEDLEVGDVVKLTYGDDGEIESIQVSSVVSLMMEQNQNGQSTGVESYASANTYTEDTSLSNETLTSTGTDENTVLVQEGANVAISDSTISRQSDDSTGGDNSSFYGVGAAVLTTDGKTEITDSEITTDAAGGAGVFAYGDGEAEVSDTTITTKQDTSGGIHVAGGGTLTATNCTVTTNGESSAAIRSDRGGGTITVNKGTYTSNGIGSPAIYSTADITVSDATLAANGSEAICIEGSNSIKLTDCTLSGNMSDDSQNDTTWNVILYQSMSGDSEEGNATFTMEGGKLIAQNGGMFYTTNTEYTFELKNVDITYADDNEFFLKCTGNSNKRVWGTAGANGADSKFTATDQEMEGDVIWDSISKLDFYMSGSSTLTGAVLDDETNAGDGGDGYCNMYIDEDSTWIVTGDSTLTKLCNAGTIKDEDGKTVSIVGTDGTKYVTGNSQYTITVGTYSDTVD